MAIPKKIFFILGALVIAILFRSRLHQQVNFTTPQIIKGVELVNPSVNMSAILRGNVDSIIDGNISSELDLMISQDTVETLELNCNEYCDLGSVEVLFSGRPVRKLTVEYLKESNSEWTKLSEIDNNDKSTIKIGTPNDKGVSTRKIRITLFEPSATDNIITLGEVRVFSPMNTSGADKVLKNIFGVERQPLSYVFYLILIISFTLLIGFGLSRKKATEISALTLSIAAMKGIGAIAILGLIQIFILPRIPLNTVFVLLVTFSIIRLFGTELSVKRSAIYLGIFSIIILVNTGIFFYFKDQYENKVTQISDAAYDFSPYYPTPYGAYQTDFLLPYGVAKVWKYNIPQFGSQAMSMMSGYKLSDRTPLLALYTIPFLNLFGDRMFIFEMISIFLMPLFLFSSWLLLREIFGVKIAYLATIFLVFNHWLLFAIHFGQVRLLTLFFIELFLYFLIRLCKSESNNLTIITSITATMAFISHPFSIIYIFSGAIFQMAWLLKEKKRTIFSTLAKTYGLPLLFFVLWTLWARSQLGNSLLISSLTSATWQKTNSTMTSSITPKFDQFNLLIKSKVDNLLGIFLTDPRKDVVRSYGFLRTTLPPAIGLTMIPFVLFATMFQKIKFKKYILVYSTCVIFFSVFVFLGFYAILGLNWYHLGLIPLFLGIGVSLMFRLPTFFWWLVLSIHVFEYYYVSWIFFPEASGNLIKNLPKDTSLIPSMVVLSTVVAALLTLLVKRIKKRNELVR